MSSDQGCERVVVIQDASRDVSPSAIRGIAQGLSLKPGDALKFLGVLHQVNNPSTLSFMAAGKYLGYKIRLDSSSMVRTNQKILAEEISRKKEEYQNNEEIVKISKQCETEQIEFHVEVRAGTSLKTVGVRSAKRFRATWVILDRHTKKERRYFLENLSCRISRMKKDNSIEQLRGHKPKSGTNNKLQVETSPRRSYDQVSYDEMIPGSPTKKQVDIGGEPPLQNSRKSASFYKRSSGDQLIISTTSTGLSTEASNSSCNEAKSFSYLQFQEEDEDDMFSIDLNKVNERSSEDSGNQNLKNNSEINWNSSGSPTMTTTNEVFQNFICSVCKNRRPKIGWKRDFSYGELQVATGGFSDKNYLSEGGFGSVYKGEITGMKIAVKQHNNASFQGEREFKSEVQVLSKARHQNLVILLGSCSEGSHRLLVYEYVCNGSLDQHLSKHTRTPLSWKNRMKIAMGAAKGLQYLHENNIIHRDMRPNNILVTHDFEPLLGDFGLARTQRGDSDHSSETGVVGTLGYLAPEYAECGKVSKKTDVYSFGVVLLQLITGLKTTDKILGGKSLVGWARPLLKERNYPDLIDPRILDCHDVHQLFWMVRVAEKCLSKDPQKRLPMDSVVDALNYIMVGNAICNIGGFSPGPSDSVSIGSDSSESSPISQSEDATSFSLDSTSTSSISQLSKRFPPTPPIQTHWRLPPSPPLTPVSSTVNNNNNEPENSRS